jgi:hypothetical protein
LPYWPALALPADMATLEATIAATMIAEPIRFIFPLLECLKRAKAPGSRQDGVRQMNAA